MLGAHRGRGGRHLWPNELLGGNLAQELPRPDDFAAATELVTEDMVREKLACGPDPQAHLDSLAAYAEAGFDEVYVQQIGPEQEAFFEAWASDVLPKAGSL